MTTWTELNGALVTGRDLDAADTTWVMNQILGGEAPPVVVAAFLAALHTKGETAVEVAGLVEAMLGHAIRIDVPGRSVDVVGTGGDGAHTVNVSTMAALVVAGTGVTVVKHGNRAASSKTGTADVLEHLGVNLELAPERVAELAVEVGITFCFARAFHPAMRFVGPIRAELGFPTVFNFLGPLTNPAQPAASAIGVASARMAPVMAQVLADRGREALVFRNLDGLDEIAATAPTAMWEARGGAVTHSEIDVVRDLGVAPIAIADLKGGEAAQNAAVVESMLAGQLGPVRETVLLNAAAGLVADGTLEGTSDGPLVERLRAGMGHAAAAIDDGRAAAALARWVAASSAS